MHYIILDTNIYRELGVSFHKNIDYDYLWKFIDKSPHELLILDVVFEELLDFFEKEHIANLLSDYKKLMDKFEKNDYVESITPPNFEDIREKAVELFKSDLEKSCWKILKSACIDPVLLIQFLLDNKRQSKKDNTRDFLIFLGLIDICKKGPSDKIVFISRDKIFTENEFLQNLLKKENVQNLEVLDSISKYMSEYGVKVDFLTEDQVLKSFNHDIILEELKNDIECFPSYVSYHYSDGTNKPPKNLSVELLNVSLNDFYSYSEDKMTTVLITSLIVGIKAVYDVETNVNLHEYGKKQYFDGAKHRIDSKNRPIYEGSVLFIFESELDLKNKQIIKQNFVDFIPDWHINE